MTGLQFQIKFLQKLQNHISKDLDIRTIDTQYYIDRGRELYIDEIIQNYRGQEEYRKRLGDLLQTQEIVRPVAPNAPRGNSARRRMPLPCYGGRWPTGPVAPH